MHYYAALMCFTLIFWLLIATPVPLKIQIIGIDPIYDPSEYSQSRITFQSVDDDSFDSLQFPTIRDAIGIDKK